MNNPQATNINIVIVFDIVIKNDSKETLKNQV